MPILDSAFEGTAVLMRTSDGDTGATVDQCLTPRQGSPVHRRSSAPALVHARNPLAQCAVSGRAVGGAGWSTTDGAVPRAMAKAVRSFGGAVLASSVKAGSAARH